MEKQSEKKPQKSKLLSKLSDILRFLYIITLLFIFFRIGIRSHRDMSYLSRKAIQMRNYAVEEMKSFDSSAKILSKKVELVKYYWFEVRISAEIENNKKALLVLRTDMFGEKEKKKIFVEDKLIEEIEYPERNIVINIFERFMKFLQL